MQGSRKLIKSSGQGVENDHASQNVNISFHLKGTV